ncbi:MAG: penicillin-binding protein 2, partial [Candidatus Binatia bacterium]
MDLKRFVSSESSGLKARLSLLRAAIFLLFSVLLLQFWYLQVINEEKFKRLAENNRIRVISLQGPRGLIYDRNKRSIVSNRPSFNLTLVPEDVQEPDAILELFNRNVDLDMEEAKEKIGKAYPYKPLVIKRDISRQELAFIEEHKIDLPGVNFQIEPLRFYKFNDLGAHILGYLGEISEVQLKSQRDGEYRSGDMIGQYGLEKEFEPLLKGVRAHKLVEVDALGKEIKVLQNGKFIPGHSLVLTLDLDLQMLAEELLRDKRGVIVVLEPKTGEVLVLASHPNFDPNLFASGINRKAWRELSKDRRYPLQNRAIQGLYPPGSVFKIIMAAAALEEGVIEPDTTFYCPGSFPFGGRTFRGWRDQGHGTVDVHRALVESCDVFFYHLGHRLGIDTIAKYSLAFGFGKPTGLELAHEKAGTVPSTTWKKKVLKQPWYPGETISVAIGQGYNQMTPLLLANMIAAVANGGKLFRPFLIKRIETALGQVVKENSSQL